MSSRTEMAVEHARAIKVRSACRGRRGSLLKEIGTPATRIEIIRGVKAARLSGYCRHSLKLLKYRA